MNHQTLKTQQNRKANNLKTSKEVRRFVSVSWQKIDAELNNIRETCRGNPPLLYEAIIKQITIRFKKWCAPHPFRTLLASYQVRPFNPRNYLKSERKKVVSGTRKSKKGVSKSGRAVLRKGVSKTISNLRRK